MLKQENFYKTVTLWKRKHQVRKKILNNVLLDKIRLHNKTSLSLSKFYMTQILTPSNLIKLNWLRLELGYVFAAHVMNAYTIIHRYSNLQHSHNKQHSSRNPKIFNISKFL